jgi:hypothetical protein
MANLLLKLHDYAVIKGPYVDLTAIPMPPQGGKCWVLERKGQFVLERGPGTLRTIACTSSGSGTLLAIDGIPDENGEIPADDGHWRQLFKANPVVMGSWMLDAGFVRGLTIRQYGGQEGTPPIASLVWVPYKAPSRAK